MERQIILLLRQDQWILKDENTPYSLKYKTDFDAYDHMAAARLLYYLIHKIEVNTLDEYVGLLFKKEYLELLKVINESPIIETNWERRVFLVNINVDGHKTNQLPEEYQNLLNQPQKPVKKYILLITEPEYHLCWHDIMEAIHFGIYKQENEQWITHLVFENDFPQQLDDISGIVVTGSSSSVYDKTLTWIEPLMNFLKLVSELKIRTIGICFGYQVMAESLGGKAQKMKQELQFNVGRVQIKNHLIISGKDYQPYVYILHGDEVTETYQNVGVCMSADHCKIYGYQNEYQLCVQFHPEFNPLIVIYALAADEQLKNKEEFIQLAKDSFQKGQDDSYIVWRMMLEFLKEGKMIEFK